MESIYVDRALNIDDTLTVIEFIESTDYPIETFRVEEFWDTFEDGLPMYADDMFIEWLGYVDRRNFIHLVESTGEQFECFGGTRRSGSCLILTSACLKAIMLSPFVPRRDVVYKRYFDLIGLFREYSKYIATAEARELELAIVGGYPYDPYGSSYTPKCLPDDFAGAT